MIIVIDTNILLSGLIKDSLTRRILLESGHQFLFPILIFKEYEEHKEEILTKSGMERDSFNRLMSLILTKVKVVPSESLEPFSAAAKELVKDIDPKDDLFMACALAHQGSILWSDDKALKRQNVIRVINTPELNEFLKNSLISDK